ncbi:MAG: FCD domain-containing protein, partial [Burkholderiaceae bacterium]|nr:FCD domain-containing protein [Burkholderiaceae bacterium]
LEQAKTLGLVTAKPKLGIHRSTYAFSFAAQESIKFSIQIDPKYFIQLSEMRKALEKAFWYESIAKLNSDDHFILSTQLDSAKVKLSKIPAEIPHVEHKTLHMTIYRHLDNTFVKGILEGFWFAYEIVGMNQFSEIDYLKKVWDYHSKIVNAIYETDYDLSYRLLIEHLDLIQNRGHQLRKYNFE